MVSTIASQKRPVIKKLGKAIATEVFDTYWKFATERQEIFHKRISNEKSPWTNDAVLQQFKFTNAYRASDRVSQFLIRNVIYEGPQTTDEIFFRTILFKLFNKIETWQALEASLGPLTWDTFKFQKYNTVFSNLMQRGDSIYSAAYIMPSGASSFGDTRKHQCHLHLIELMMKKELPARLANAESMESAFALLREMPMIGDFLAYQFAIDLNYSTLMNFSEMDFVVPGPGARDGIRKCFGDLGGLTEAQLITEVCLNQDKLFEQLGLNFRTLFGRKLQLIDCQNLFCEVDKYARVVHPQISGRTGRTRIKQTFKPNKHELPDLFFPPKWNLQIENKYLQLAPFGS